MKILDKDENLINKNYILKVKTDRVTREMRLAFEANDYKSN